MTNQNLPPQGLVLQMLLGSCAAQALGSVARLGVADQLVEGPKHIGELASAVGAHPESLRRVLRALATTGIFACDAEGRWSLTPAAETLRTDVPASLRFLAMAETDHAHWRTWQRMNEGIKSGEPQATAALGCAPWDYYAKHPEEGAIFSRAMANVSSMSIGPVLAGYDFPAEGRVADIGGAFGALLAEVLRKQPGLQGVLFDLPHVVEGAGEVLGDVQPRVERVGGDFTKDKLPSADLYLLKHVLHDWDDEHSTTILRAVRDAMNPGSKLLVIELHVEDEPKPGPAVWMDLHMMVTLGGKERTPSEYASLFEGAGLKLSRTLHTESPFVLLEATLG